MFPNSQGRVTRQVHGQWEERDADAPAAGLSSVLAAVQRAVRGRSRRSDPHAARAMRPRPQLARFCAVRTGSAVRMRIGAQGSCREPPPSEAPAAQLLDL